MGLLSVVILFACVRCPPAKRKKPFLHLSFAVSACVSFRVSIFAGPAVCVRLYTKKKKQPFLWVVSPWVVCLVSPIEQIRTLQAGCRFGLLPLFCLCLSASLLLWGLQYSINSLCRLHRCGLYNGILLLSFSWCFPFYLVFLYEINFPVFV